VGTLPNEIAAGMPILINDSLRGKYYLPAEWVGNSNDIFILKIRLCLITVLIMRQFLREVKNGFP